MQSFRKIVDNREQASWASKMRKHRFELFLHLLEKVDRPLQILDVGGSQRFWEVMEFTDVPDVHITLLNLVAPVVKHPNFSGTKGDAINLEEFADHQFDIVFSNSVIEHVGNYEQQKQMAQEVQRVGQRYFVQTPNYWFPIEPHFLFPGFQWLPVSVRAFLVNHFDLGWSKKIHNIQKARSHVEQIRLLREREFLALFPNAKLYKEKVFGLQYLRQKKVFVV